jgi:type III pantothenate kinase
MGLLLALDVGNTNTVLGFFEGDALVATARLTTVRERTSDEHSLFLRAVIEAKGRKVGEVDDVIVSSVVPPQDFPIRAACRDLFGIDPLYDHPSEVGADRIVNAVAAVAAHGAPCIVVDFGTATTFDVVTASGDYLGGVICPGPGISADALFSRAARLSRVDLHRPERVVGKNTAQSVQSGLFWGVLAQAEGLIARIRGELGEPGMRVVVTGGLAPLFAAASADLGLVDGDLTLRGLKILHDRNADARPARRA